MVWAPLPTSSYEPYRQHKANLPMGTRPTGLHGKNTPPLPTIKGPPEWTLLPSCTIITQIPCLSISKRNLFLINSHRCLHISVFAGDAHHAKDNALPAGDAPRAPGRPIGVTRSLSNSYSGLLSQSWSCQYSASPPERKLPRGVLRPKTVLITKSKHSRLCLFRLFIWLLLPPLLGGIGISP